MVTAVSTHCAVATVTAITIQSLHAHYIVTAVKTAVTARHYAVTTQSWSLRSLHGRYAELRGHYVVTMRDYAELRGNCEQFSLQNSRKNKFKIASESRPGSSSS